MASQIVTQKDTSTKIEYADTKAAREADIEALDAQINEFTPQEQKRLIRRIDLRLVLTLGWLFCSSLMDRTNLGIAAIAGMGTDLELVGNRYSLITVCFFPVYMLFQPVATVVLRKLGPRVFLPGIALGWGLVTICLGFVRRWTDMLALRLVLGLFEAGFFPGCVYLLSCWYPRYEQQKRYAIFYLIGITASAFSGILAFGFSQLKNHGSGPDWLGQHYKTSKDPNAPMGVLPPLAGWRWIFIWQGIITCTLALGAILLIVDFPELAVRTNGLKFLNQREVDFVVARIEKDRADVQVEPFSIKSYLNGAADLKVWGFACIFGLTTTNSYAIAFFLPIILNSGMGFGVAASQCLVAPPYALGAILMYTFAWLGDKYHMRSPFILINGLLLVIGLPLLGYAENVAVRYFGVFLATAGANANTPCILAWQANNIRGQWKRAICSAILVGFGGFGGIIGSTVFRAQDKPAYRPGILTCLLSSGLIILITLALDLKFYLANKRVDLGGKPIEKLVGFRYTL